MYSRQQPKLPADPLQYFTAVLVEPCHSHIISININDSTCQNNRSTDCFSKRIPSWMNQNFTPYKYAQLGRILNECQQLSTRSSPQWWSRSSTTTHIAFDWCSLIWGFSESCTIGQGINSQPENVSSNVLYWHFHRSPTVWLQFERGIFNPSLSD